MARGRFSYYDRLGAADRKIYRASDAIAAVPVPRADDLHPLVHALERTLGEGKRGAVARAAGALVDALLSQLGAPGVIVRVRQVRPRIHQGELHGLYTLAAEEKPTAQIEVWMRTAAHARTVAHRTFLRTLLHEVVHHLDVTVLGLGDSFHTQGFFQRESSLVRQLLPGPGRSRSVRADAPATTPGGQLSLFDKGE
jgi:hypothetical protein